MTDTMTNKPMCVLTVGTAGPYLRLPFSQLEDVRRLLDSRGIFYWVAENAISLNGAPEVIVVNFGHEGDPVLVQSILDNVR